jgi:hypothetical protein
MDSVAARQVQVGQYRQQFFLFSFASIMTSPKLGLLPAGSDDRLTVLPAAQLVSRRLFEFTQRARTEVRQRMPFQPGPQVLDLIEVRRIGRQLRHLDGAVTAVQISTHDAAFVLGGHRPRRSTTCA